MRIIALLLLLLAVSTLSAQNGSQVGTEVLSHYGILRLNDPEMSRVFASRLRATGEPLFLIRDFRKGIQQNDIIRFKDKAVLIDANIWETMRADKILQKLSKIPVIHLQAQSKSSIWNARGNTVTNAQEKKGYFLGGEFLNILEDYFSDTPTALEMVIRFEGDQMVLMAPKELMKSIAFTKVIARKPQGRPEIISPAPAPRHFIGQPFHWRIWAINPANPQSELKYSITGELPSGLSWEKETHSIVGTPDSVGSWSIVASVLNKERKRDTLAFTFETRHNAPPIIANSPTSELVAEQPWIFTPVLSDPDHATDDLTIAVVSKPDFMLFDSTLHTFSFIAPANDSINPEEISFEIAVTDPLGASVSQSFQMRVLSPHLALKARGVSLNLPLDTLIQGRTYTWHDSLWLGDKVQITEISGTTDTYYDTDTLSHTGSLTLAPHHPGPFSIHIAFTIEGVSFEATKQLFVLKNEAPVFRSALNTRTFTEEQEVIYRPQVTDRENDSIIEIVATDHKGRVLQWSDAPLKLNTSKTGKYLYEFSATDATNQRAYQRISYEVIPKDRKWDGVDLEITHLKHRTPVQVMYRNGSARFGIFFHDITKIPFNDKFLTGFYQKSAPFVMAETNLLGERNAAQGTYLNVGAGINFRLLKPGLVTGGILIGSSGKYTNSDGEPWVFEYTAQFFAKQAYVFTDTNGFGRMDSTSRVVDMAGQCYDQYNTNMSDAQSPQDEGRAQALLIQCVDGLPKDSVETSQLIPENIEMALDEFDDDTNLNLLIQIETWYPLKYGFWAGPVFWKDAVIFKGEVSETRAGFGLRHVYNFDIGSFNLAYESSLRLGWAGDGSDSRILWDIDLHFGK